MFYHFESAFFGLILVMSGDLCVCVSVSWRVSTLLRWLIVVSLFVCLIVVVVIVMSLHAPVELLSL